MVKVGKKSNIIEGHTHQVFEDVIELIGAFAKPNLMLVGPTGTGKSTLAEQLGEALGLPWGFVSCSGGLSETRVLGYNNIKGEYISTQFVRVYENGGVCLIDEIDAADENVLITINAALANGHLAIEARKNNPIAKRHKDCVIICAANTFGRVSYEYSARNNLDRSTLDRFTLSTLYMDYDQTLEKLILKDEDLCKVLWKVRETIQEYTMSKPLTTRAFSDIRQLLDAEIPYQKIVDKFLLPMNEEERIRLQPIFEQYKA